MIRGARFTAVTRRRCMASSAKRPVATGYSARTPTQHEYIQLLHSRDPTVVIATGVAGSGKTLLATYVGVQKLLSNEVRKIVITRPAVSVDEQHGFLPGSLDKKMEPWVAPIYDILGTQFPRSKMDLMVKEKIIEICPLAYMRGRTFDYTWIICDEAQNMTPNQMLMVLTRIGKDSKLVITGDTRQHDRGYDINGLADLTQRVRRNYDDNPPVRVVEFHSEDVQRNPVIPYILGLYE